MLFEHEKDRGGWGVPLPKLARKATRVSCLTRGAFEIFCNSFQEDRAISSSTTKTLYALQ
jgi:hypothetical protein